MTRATGAFQVAPHASQGHYFSCNASADSRIYRPLPCRPRGSASPGESFYRQRAWASRLQSIEDIFSIFHITSSCLAGNGPLPRLHEYHDALGFFSAATPRAFTQSAEIPRYPMTLREFLSAATRLDLLHLIYRRIDIY